jgi:hypothetical protein
MENQSTRIIVSANLDEAAANKIFDIAVPRSGSLSSCKDCGLRLLTAHLKLLDCIDAGLSVKAAFRRRVDNDQTLSIEDKRTLMSFVCGRA